MGEGSGTSLIAKETEELEEAEKQAIAEAAENEPSEGLQDHLFADSFLIGIGSMMTIKYVAGGSLLAGFGLGLLSGLGLGVLAHICMQIAVDRRETLVGKIGGWTLTMAIATAVWWFYVEPQLALSMGGAGLAWTYARTLFKHQKQDRRRRVEQLKQLRTNRLHSGKEDIGDDDGHEGSWIDRIDDVPDGLIIALESLPKSLPDRVGHTLKEGLENYCHLREVLTDESIASSPVDNEAMLAEAEATLMKMTRRARVVTKVVALAERRSNDEAAARSAQDALEGFERHGLALHEAASAAIQYAATESREDASRLREHAENLHHLIEAHEELAEL
jgi:hypothetical protein